MTSKITVSLQSFFDKAVAKLATAHSGDSTRMAELNIRLADAQARLHDARQAEVRNLLVIANSDQFTADDRFNANQRALEILGLA